MNTVNINGVNVYQKYGMILSSKSIQPAKAKTVSIDIPGMDGKLDITDSMGIVRYSNRNLSFNFALIGNQIKTYALYEKIANEFDGARVNVILSESPAYYYEGRITEMSYEQGKGYAYITMEMDALPYAKTVQIFKKTSSGTSTITAEGSRMPTVPEWLIEDGEVDISFKGKSYHLTAGTYALQDFIMTEGMNEFQVNGNANVTMSYRKGKL